MHASMSESQLRMVLPLEIWMSVFKCIRQEQSDSLYPHEHITTAIWYLHSLDLRRYKQALKAKSALVQVCREWNAALTPLLYEHVAINLAGASQSFIDTVNHRPDIAGFVQRLDLYIQIDSDVPTCSPLRRYKLPELLTAVLSPLGSLKVLLVSGPSTMSQRDHFQKASPKDRAIVQLEKASPTLECIRWLETRTFAGEWNLRIPAVSWVQFLQSHPNLTSIQPPIVEWPDPKPSNETWPHLPVIHGPNAALVLSAHLPVADAQGNLLALSRIGKTKGNNKRTPKSSGRNWDGAGGAELRIVFGTDVETERAWRWKRDPNSGPVEIPVVKFFGEYITSVDFFHRMGWWNAGEEYPNRCLEGFARGCPNLRELGVGSCWCIGMQVRPVFPRVETLRLGMDGKGFGRDACQRMLEMAMEAKREGKFPCLQKVRFVNERLVLHLERFREGLGLDGFLSEFFEHGVVVEDWEGNRLL